jgi:AcrR family transcriptional regulator
MVARTSKLAKGTIEREAPRRGRPRRGPDPERFQEILDAAAETILAKGYSATSIQDIADAVGILKGSLYHYVRSKEDFLFAIIKDVYDAALAEIAPIVASTDGALERLRAFVDTHVHFGVRHLTAFTIQVRELPRLSPQRREEITKGGDAYLGALRTILRDGQKEGVIDKKLDVRLTSFVILGELNYLTTWYNPQGRMSPERISANYSGLILSSVISDDGLASVGGIEKLRRGVLP